MVSGDLLAIDWSDGPYFIKTETDPSGGTNYTISGTSQLLSVPYALFSGSAGILAGEITESQISDPGSDLEVTGARIQYRISFCNAYVLKGN